MTYVAEVLLCCNDTEDDTRDPLYGKEQQPYYFKPVSHLILQGKCVSLFGASTVPLGIVRKNCSETRSEPQS